MLFKHNLVTINVVSYSIKDMEEIPERYLKKYPVNNTADDGAGAQAAESKMETSDAVKETTKEGLIKN